MKLFLILFLFCSTALAQSPWYYGSGAAVNLENVIQQKNGTQIITGNISPLNSGYNAPKGSLYYSTNGTLYIKQDAGFSNSWFQIGPLAGYVQVSSGVFDNCIPTFDTMGSGGTLIQCNSSNMIEDSGKTTLTSVFETADSSGTASGQKIRSSFTVQSGTPITDTDVFNIDLSSDATFNDSFDFTTAYGLGWAGVGYAGSISIAPTKTIPLASIFLGEAIVNSGSEGTITKGSVFDARGFSDADGVPLTRITDMAAFRASDNICAVATSCYGISVEDVDADNFLSKSLQIGGTKAPLGPNYVLKAGNVRVDINDNIDQVQSLDVNRSVVTDFYAARFTSNTADTNTQGEVLEIKRVTSSDMIDNFGPEVSFIIQDPGAEEIIAKVSAVRSGVDNNGKLLLKTSSGGTLATRMSISPTGVVNVSQLTASLPVKTDASKNLISAAIALATDISGILPIANGGTNSSTALSGSSIIVSNGTQIVQGAAGTSTTLLHGNASGVPTYSAVSLTADVSGVLPVANGGTNSSTALSGSSIMISNGTQVIQGTAGTTTTVLHGNAAGSPTYGAVSLTADISGILPLANGGTNKNMTAVAGGIVWTDSDSQEVSAAGSTGQVLMSNGTSAPTYADGFNLKLAVASKTANYTAASTDSVIKCDATSGTFTITLPTASGITGRVYYIKKMDTSANAVTIDPNSTETIDGATTYDITDQYHTIPIVSDGTNWIIL